MLFAMIINDGHIIPTMTEDHRLFQWGTIEEIETYTQNLPRLRISSVMVINPDVGEIIWLNGAEDREGVHCVENARG